MLVLTCRKGKKVFIDVKDTRIAVEVIEPRGNAAKLAIIAPPEYRVSREK